jgi:hypothetical protein
MQPIVLCFCITVLFTTAFAAEKKTIVTVEAGNFDRRSTVVAFSLPQNLKAETVALQRERKLVPLQVGKDRRAFFVVEDLRKGTRANYDLVATGPAAAGISEGQVLSRREQSKVKFSWIEPGGKVHPLLDYQAEPGAFPRDDIKAAFRRGGYLHSVHTPSGKVVTDDFPPNHIHHYGVWWAWTKTVFDGREPDFWNMGDNKGRVEFEALEETWSGAVHGGFRSKHRFVDLTAPKPITALNEIWEVTVYAVGLGSAAKYSVFDLVSEQQCATSHPLKLPEYRYGGVGVRGNWAWNGKEKASFLTSEGETDRDKGNTTQGRWCDMGGQLEGGPAGIAILCHPQNYRAPQPMRLHPTEPFFNFAPQQAGDMEIKPGEKYVARYRFVVHDGPPDRAELDRLWNDYAHPPVVKLE